MIRTSILPLFIICILALTAISGCLPMGSNKPKIPAVWVSAIAVPDYSINESQLEAQLGGVPFKIILYVEPLQPKDLHVDMQGQLTSEDLAELLPPVGPVMAEFGFFSDGLGYPDDIYADVVGENVSGTIKEESVSGDDVSFDYAVWTQVLPVDTDDMAQRRVWYKSFTINSDEASFIADIDSLAQMDLEEELTAGTATPTVDFAWDRKTSFQSNRYRVQFWFVQDSTEAANGGDPIALIPETLTIPISPLVTMNRVDPEPDVIPSEVVVDQAGLVDFWDLQYIPFSVSLDLTPAEGVSVFNIDKDISFDNGQLYNDYFAASAAIPAEAESYNAAALNYGFGIANFVDEDPEGSDCDGDPEVGSFGFVSDGLCFSSVYGIPIDRDSLFYPNEAHIVELPYTFWLVVEPSLDYPPNHFETEPYDLKVIVIPAMGGQVQMSTAEGAKPYDKGPEGTWQSSMAYDWFIDQPQEVTLTAIPSEGYRFVAWETDDFYTEIEDPSSPILKLNVTPPLKLSDMWRTTTVRAYFALLIEEPQDEAPLENPLSVGVNTVSETIEDESGCSSIVTINYQAADLTGGDRPVSYVQINVDEQELTSWSGTPTAHYQDNTAIESDCEETRVIELTATNSEGQTITTTNEALIPPLNTHFGYGILDYPDGGGCQMQLFIEYEANDLTTPDDPITNVVVKANGQVWDSSGTISTNHYEDSFMRLVGCGHTYNIEVIGTDADGNKYTYRETVEIPSPSPEPPDEPPPPQTTLYAAFAASAHCTSSGPECSCQLSISFDGNDLTGGTYPVTKVVLRVNGQVWHDSGSISQTTYHQTEQRTVNCGETFNIEVTVNNTLGQTVTSTGSITTPTP